MNTCVLQGLALDTIMNDLILYWTLINPDSHRVGTEVQIQVAWPPEAPNFLGLSTCPLSRCNTGLRNLLKWVNEERAREKWAECPLCASHPVCTHALPWVPTPWAPRCHTMLWCSQNLLNAYPVLSRTNGDLIMVIDNNKKITPPLEDKLIYLFETIHFQPVVPTGYLIRARLNSIKLM